MKTINKKKKKTIKKCISDGIPDDIPEDVREDIKKMLQKTSWSVYSRHIPGLKPYTLIPCPIHNSTEPLFMVYWNPDEKMWMHRCFCQCISCERFTGDQNAGCVC